MVDVKIPRTWRAGIPIVCSSEQIVWVVGQRIDERMKVTEETKRILCLKFTQT
jgi:tRNA(Ile)-lysidine synthase